MMFLNNSFNVESNTMNNNTRYELYANLLDLDVELKAFCKKRNIKAFPEMMQTRFIGRYEDMIELIDTQLAPHDPSKRATLATSLSRTL